MLSSYLKRITRRFTGPLATRLASWRSLILPGVLIVSLVCGMRGSGVLQAQEWTALDALSRNCPLQPISQRISPPMPQQVVIVGIEEADYKALGGFPISDGILAQALTQLQQYRPRAIGLDLFRDLPIGEGQTELRQAIQSMPNVIAVEVALNEERSLNIKPPAGIGEKQTALADVVVDDDGKLRRMLLAARDWDRELKFSLSLKLAQQYLETEGITLQHGERSSDPLRFGKATLPRFQPNSGGYVRANANGNQMLMNFCMLQQPFETIALREVLAGNVDPEKIRDRIVLIGTVADSVKDSFITAAVRETLYSQRIAGRSVPNQLIYGVELHAIATQQIIYSMLDRPYTLHSLPEVIEYLWIVLWGILGISVSVTFQSPWKSILSLAIVTLLLVGISYIALSLNWWIPVVPTTLSFGGAGLVTAFFDRDVRFELEQRRRTIEQTYGAVHNGPLQQLAAMLRSLDDDQTLATEQLRQQLQGLNTEMRSLFEHMRQDATDSNSRLYLADNTALDLQQPLSYLLYQVYEHTLNQPLPGFNTVQNFISPNFECLIQTQIKLEHKRGLCLFLQEALLNVGKHATEATCIDVVCHLKGSHYQLQIIDNGLGAIATPMRVREGTRQAMALAQTLKGQFQRYPNTPRGVVCELVWPKG